MCREDGDSGADSCVHVEAEVVRCGNDDGVASVGDGKDEVVEDLRGGVGGRQLMAGAWRQQIEREYAGTHGSNSSTDDEVRGVSLDAAEYVTRHKRGDG